MNSLKLQDFKHLFTKGNKKARQVGNIGLCGLCGLVPADKTNSHIIPRFMAKRVLSKSPRNVLSFKSSPQHSKPEVDLDQDTMKEDHILCTGCEKYFSILETEFCNDVHQNVRDINSTNPIINTSIKGRKRKLFKTANTTLSYLLIYSIIFRCHIAGHTTFSTFYLKRDEFDKLRNELNKYRCGKTEDIMQIVSQQNLTPVSEFYLSVSEHFDRSTSNLLMQMTVPRNSDVYYLILGEYRVLFSFSKLSGFDGVNNLKGNWLSIDLIDNTDWSNMYDRNLADVANVFKSHRENH
jgi:hypothetical protein